MLGNCRFKMSVNLKIRAILVRPFLLKSINMT